MAHWVTKQKNHSLAPGPAHTCHCPLQTVYSVGRGESPLISIHTVALTTVSIHLCHVSPELRPEEKQTFDHLVCPEL